MTEGMVKHEASIKTITAQANKISVIVEPFQHKPETPLFLKI
jgi:hypothetical protein